MRLESQPQRERRQPALCLPHSERGTSPGISLRRLQRRPEPYCPVILDEAFVLGLLGTQIGDGKFEDINLGEVIYKTFEVLMDSVFLAVVVFSFTEPRTYAGIDGRALI